MHYIMHCLHGNKLSQPTEEQLVLVRNHWKTLRKRVKRFVFFGCFWWPKSPHKPECTVNSEFYVFVRFETVNAKAIIISNNNSEYKLMKCWYKNEKNLMQNLYVISVCKSSNKFLVNQTKCSFLFQYKKSWFESSDEL